MGDIFVYLVARGDLRAPGPIVVAVRDAILRAQNQAKPGEPLIVITHSMGGNIFYDLLTYYVPTMNVALWVSVGGQVAQFEEMKLFHASSSDGPNPQQGLRPQARAGVLG